VPPRGSPPRLCAFARDLAPSPRHSPFPLPPSPFRLPPSAFPLRQYFLLAAQLLPLPQLTASPFSEPPAVPSIALKKKSPQKFFTPPQPLASSHLATTSLATFQEFFANRRRRLLYCTYEYIYRMLLSFASLRLCANRDSPYPLSPIPYPLSPITYHLSTDRIAETAGRPSIPSRAIAVGPAHWCAGSHLGANPINEPTKNVEFLKKSAQKTRSREGIDHAATSSSR
jgi:hypothetical protein